MTVIRQSTARTILIGPILDADGVAKTNEVVANIRITKNGTVGEADASATLTHDHSGKYRLALTAADTDTVGVIQISLNSGTNDMVPPSWNVVEEAVFDALFAASAAGYQVPIWANAASTVNLSGTEIGSVAELSAVQAEPGQGAPAANASPLQKLAYLFKAWRNKKTQTATTYSLFADDATTVDQKATVSDDGVTTSISEVTSGP